MLIDFYILSKLIVTSFQKLIPIPAFLFLLTSLYSILSHFITSKTKLCSKVMFSGVLKCADTLRAVVGLAKMLRIIFFRWMFIV